MSKRYGIAAEYFADFVWLMSEAGITWRFAERPHGDRVMVDVDVELRTTLTFDLRLRSLCDDVIRVAEVP